MAASDDDLFAMAGIRPSGADAQDDGDDLFAMAGLSIRRNDREPVPEMSAASLARDLGVGALKIGPTAVKGAADIARMATGDRVGKDTSEAMERGMRSMDEVWGSERAQVQKRNFERDMADENVGIGEALWRNKGALSDQVLPTVGSMFLPVGVAAGATKLATMGKAAQTLDKAALAARVATAQKVAGIGTVAAQNAADTFAEMVDKGVSMEKAYIAAGITVPFSVIAGKLTEGGAEVAIAKALTGTQAAGKAGAMSVVKEAVKASAKEGAQEIGEEAGQIAGEAYGTDALPTARQAGKRMAVAGTLGAVVGGGANVAVPGKRGTAEESAGDTERAEPTMDGKPRDVVMDITMPDGRTEVVDTSKLAEQQRAQQPDGAPQEMTPALAEQRLAELEVIDSSTGLNTAQQVEREALAQRVAEDKAAEIERETVGEAPLQGEANAEQTQQARPDARPQEAGDSAPAGRAAEGAAQPAADTQQAAGGDVHAAGVEADTAPAPFDPAQAQAKTWPAFVLERGHKVSELRSGTPAWDSLQSEWAAVKTVRSGVNPEGSGAVGAPEPEIQNRDRSRPASIVQMQAMAQNPDYMRLGVSRSPESGAPMVFAVGDRHAAVRAAGRGDVAVMSDGQRVPFRYAVMEAGDVQPSNFADGSVNPLFDAQHPGTVKALNNGRTAGVRAAYERGTANGYKQELLQDAAMHGIDPAVIEGMRAPMLVRLYSEKDNRANMGAKSQSQALGLSATEQAETDAHLMDGAVLDALAPGALDSAGNRDFARAFVGRMQAQGQDVAGMLDAGGQLSPAGVVRMQAALVHKAYGDGDLVESLFGSTDNDIRAIGEALKAVAGEWADLRHAVEAGAVNPQADTTGNLLQAIRMVQKARRERAALYDAVQQVDITTGEAVDDVTVGMLRLLYSGHYLTRPVGRERLEQSLRQYIGAALATSAEGDMFGEQVGPAQILSGLTGYTLQGQGHGTSTVDTAAAQGGRVTPGGDVAGQRATESGRAARGQGSDRAGQEVVEAGRGRQGQAAQAAPQQQDGEGDQGTGQDGRGEVAQEAPAFSRAPSTKAAYEARIDALKAPEVWRRIGDTPQPNRPSAGAKRILTEKNLAGWRKANTPAQSRTVEAGQSAAVEHVQAQVDAIKAAWKNAPEVVVVTSMQDAKVPQRVRAHDAQQKSQGAAGEPEGFFYQGKVYIVAGQVNQPHDVARVLFHEALGHYGLRGVFGDALQPILQQIALARPQEVRRKAEQYGLDWDKREDRLIAAEEVLAEMAEATPELGFSRRAVAAIRTWLRANVPGFTGLRVSDAEIIRDYILPARGWVERGRQTAGDQADAAVDFARHPGFSAAVDAAVKAGTRGELGGRAHVEIGTLPPALAAAGIPAGDLKTSAKVLQKVVFDHGVPPSVVKRIPELLEKPVMVFRSATVDGSFVAVTSEMVRGAPLIVAISPESTTGGFALNFVPSLYPRDDLQAIQRWMNATKPGEQLLTYLDKEQSPAWFGSTRLQLPGEFRTTQGLQARSVATQADSVNAPGGTPMYSRGGMVPAAQTKGRLSQLQAKVRYLISPESVDAMLYNWQDKFIDLKRIQAHIRALNGTVTETNDAYLGEELYHKRVAKRSENFMRDEVRPVLMGLKSAGVKIEEFDRFLHARHAPEANKVMAERNPSQATIDAERAQVDTRVKNLRQRLQAAQARGTAAVPVQKALGQALLEKEKWDSAQAFQGTEEERLSLSGMSDAEAAQVLGGYTGAKRQALDALAAKVDAINEGTLATLDGYGLMDKATLNTWRSTYQHYVPLHRDEAHPDSRAHPIGQGFSTKGDAAKRRTGSNEKVTNILGHIVMQREAALTRGEKNNVVKRLYLLAAQNPMADLWTLDLPSKKAVDPDTGLVRTVPDPVAALQDNVVSVRIGGKNKHIVFNPRNERAARLALAIKNMDAMELDRFTRSMGQLTRWFAAVNTQYNPIFGVVNLTRDLQATLLQLSNTPLAGKQMEVFGNVRKNVLAIYRDLRHDRKGTGAGQGPWAQLWEQMQMDGGTTGYRDLFIDPKERVADLQKELDKIDQGKASAAARGITDWLSDFNETMENTTRLAVYKAALDHGLSRQQAASIAKNITVNFNRKGRNTAVAGSWYAFLNAAIQGNKRMLETLAGPAGMKVMAGGVTLGMLSSLAGMMVMGGGDDDEWKKIPEFVKERSIIIPLSRQDYVTIPMPLGFHVFPNIGRKLVEAAAHDDPVKSRAGYLADLALIVADAYNPLGGAGNFMQMVAPTPFDPVVAVISNADWTGKPIYREQRSGLDPKPGHARARDSTAEPFRWVSRIINAATGGNEWREGAWSPTPEAIEYLFGQFTGGVGREVAKAGAMARSAVTGEELAAHQIILTSRFYGNTRGANGQSTAYYDNIKRINGDMDEAKGRIGKGEDAEAVLLDVPLAPLRDTAKHLDKRVTELRKARKLVQDGDDPLKREKVEAINAEIEGSMRRLNGAVEDALKKRGEAG